MYRLLSRLELTPNDGLSCWKQNTAELPPEHSEDHETVRETVLAPVLRATGGCVAIQGP